MIKTDVIFLLYTNCVFFTSNLSIKSVINATLYFNNDPDGMDCVAFLSSGPYDLGAGDSIDLSFAIVFGEDEDDLINNAQQINSTSSILGDVNQDGAVNILDLVSMANLILADDYIELADINNDGELNILDIVNVVNIILNN